ncbi:MAG: helix-turn-helix domain-containing protein [Clostridia bacterium]|nr:helix-turn-helix domain-containing protein [Clostridia bacterium]
MNLTNLNPVIRTVSQYERINRTEECVSYDSRLFYMVSGDITAVVGGVKLGHLSPGHLLYIPAGTPYKLKGQYLRLVAITFDPTADNPEPEERIKPVALADFDESLVHRTPDLSPLDRMIHIEDMESERDTFLKLVSLFTSAEGTYRAQGSAILKQLLLKVIETVDEHALPARMVEALDSYIRDNAGDDISNTEIGAIFGYHPFYISKVLKDRKGTTLRQYIIAYRLKLAKKLLEESGKSVNEISEECGFNDPSYFTKTFKSAFGMTPKDYRNQTKEDFI